LKVKLFIVTIVASFLFGEQVNFANSAEFHNIFLTLANKTGGIKGKIVDESNQPLIGANVILLGINYGTASDFTGHYKIGNIPIGTYKVKFSFVGYKPVVKKITITNNRILQLNIQLKPESFQVGGITVTAKEDLLPTDNETKTKIDASEIEHYQATNLGDVLDLVPGVQKSANPGIAKTSQIAIRGSENDRLSAFGTKVIVDGEPVSNNANMQFESLTGNKFGSGNLGGSVDLREIPADNVQAVSVISGMPSVRYGDFTNGVIELKTKMGVRPQRLKIKHNPKTSEMNFGGGVALGEQTVLSYNANIARSERDLRITGDEYSRYTGQLVLSTNHSDIWKAHYKISSQAIYDEEEPKNDLRLTKNYNRGFKIGFNTWGQLKKADAQGKFDYRAYVKMKRINSKKSKLIADYIITPQNDTLASYIGTVENKGIQWTAGGRLEWHSVFFTGDYIHKILAGSELQYDANTGEGLIFDTLFNYYGSQSLKRPYKFDDLPSQTTISLYAQDKITGHYFVDFSLMFGFRYEMYRPYAFNLSGLWGNGDIVKSHQGSFFNPRVSLTLYLSKINQLRINFGKSSKSPPMSTVFPREQVFRWRNPVTGTVENYRLSKAFPNLRGYQTNQIEISYDQKFWGILGTSLTAYYRERNLQPSSYPLPIFKEINNGDKNEIYFVHTYSETINEGRNISKGIEFALRTAKVKPLNMNFKVTGAYSFSKTPSYGVIYELSPDESLGQIPNYHVPNVSVDTVIGWLYPRSGNWKDRFQLNYYVKYTNKDLGIWVTLRAEQLLTKREQAFNLKPVDESKLTEVSLRARRYYESIIAQTGKWLFNINVSKSLFPGAEVSFYVNNFMDTPGIWRHYNVAKGYTIERKRNPDLFYGLEFSMIIDKIL